MGWKIGADVVYLAEGNAAGTGAAIKWAQDLGEEEDLCIYKPTHFLTWICIFHYQKKKPFQTEVCDIYRLR